MSELNAREQLKDLRSYMERQPLDDVISVRDAKALRDLDALLADAVKMLDKLEMVTNKDFEPVNRIISRAKKLGYSNDA